MKRHWRNIELQIGVGCVGRLLVLCIVPFRFARPAIRKPERPFMGEKKSRIQMWFGPFHYWMFINEKPFELSIEINYQGGFHGSKPSGYNPLIRWFKSLGA